MGFETPVVYTLTNVYPISGDVSFEMFMILGYYS